MIVGDCDFCVCCLYVVCRWCFGDCYFRLVRSVNSVV